MDAVLEGEGWKAMKGWVEQVYRWKEIRSFLYPLC